MNPTRISRENRYGIAGGIAALLTVLSGTVLVGQHASVTSLVTSAVLGARPYATLLVDRAPAWGFVFATGTIGLLERLDHHAGELLLVIELGLLVEHLRILQRVDGSLADQPT